jgi:site-specific DNA-methyltransferase (adenine-specific)
MIKLYDVDIFKNLDQLVPDDSIDLIAVDPPYLIGYAGHDWDSHEFVEFTERWVEIVMRKLKINGTMWSFMAKDNCFSWSKCEKGFINILEEYGTIHMDNWVTWARQKGRGSNKHLKSQREELFHFTKHPTDYTWNNLNMLREVIVPYVKDGRPRGWFLDNDGMRKRFTGLGNVWTYSSPQFNGISEPQIHSSQKPVMMIERIIRLSSNENDIVLDPFMGSGSTGIACRLSNRNFIGFENDLDMYKKAEKRILHDFDIINYPGYNLYTDIQIVKYMKSITDKRVLNHIKNNIPNSILCKMDEKLDDQRQNSFF